MNTGVSALSVWGLMYERVILGSEKEAVLVIGHPQESVADYRFRRIRVEVLI
jgi:hypothetical protein